MTATLHPVQAPQQATPQYQINDRVWVVTGRDPKDLSRYVLHAATILSIDDTHLSVRLLALGCVVRVPYGEQTKANTSWGNSHPGMLPPSLWDQTS